MFFRQVAVVAAVVACASAAPAPASIRPKHVLHEYRSKPASDWVKGSRIESDAILPMRIGLTQTNLENGQDLLMVGLSCPLFDDAEGAGLFFRACWLLSFRNIYGKLMLIT